jgi:simple sugar transport system ATP-binding protein
MVHQHFMLVKPLTVAENMVLGQPSPRAPLLEKPQVVRDRITRISREYGLDVDPDARIWELSVGEQQRVEILKALYRGAEVLILDEPTAVLTPQEVQDLLGIMRRLVALGMSIVFISHKLEEVLAASDRITVLRDGRVVGTVLPQESTRTDLARMMVGREVLFRQEKTECQPGDIALALDHVWVNNDRGVPAVRGLSLQLCAGEILGIAGVAGNGQSELEEAVRGLRPVERGDIWVCGQCVTNQPVWRTVELGLAHIPSDRYRHGLIGEFSVAENTVLENFWSVPFTRHGWLDSTQIGRYAQELVEDYDVRTPSVDSVAKGLSGGNAQKLILARELSCAPRVLLAAQPTRGLDVSAIEYVHRRLLEQREAGVTILLISTELEEILSLSDRIAVMYEGEIVGIIPNHEVDVKTIGLMMAGGTRE